MLNDFFNDIFTTMLSDDITDAKFNFSSSTDSDGNVTSTMEYNGKNLNDMSPEEVDAAKKDIEKMFSSSFGTFFFGKDAMDKAKSFWLDKLDNHMLALENKSEETVEETNAEFMARRYCEDTIDGWANIPDTQKSRALKGLEDFFKWIEKQAK